MLENLCLDTVKNHPVLQCVDHYLSCLEEKLDVEGSDKEQGKHLEKPEMITPLKIGFLTYCPKAFYLLL